MLLLKLLGGCGPDEGALRWFSSYLGGSTQRVRVGGILSQPVPILRGVPQGSILGPILFVIFTNMGFFGFLSMAVCVVSLMTLTV